jgi:sugar transferase (PEP-CTERM/EpsH1 system associated)
MARRSRVIPRHHIPLVAHVLHRLDYGGLENGVVNLVNRLPVERFRHAIVCLTDYTEFSRRIERDVELISLHKREGKDVGLYARLFRAFRRLRPDLVHTRNLAAIEALAPAWLAGVPARVHGEHGWDVHDPGGVVRRYRLLRWALSPLVHRFVPLSRELERYLVERVGVRPERVTRICNGVDLERFRPRRPDDPCPWPESWRAPGIIVVGTVGRLAAVKDPMNLVEAFLILRERSPEWRRRLRLALVGDGILRPELEGRLEAAGAGDAAWLCGAREDVPELLRAMDLFALPSLAEGISNTILEAMASGLPMVVTEVGGNAELVEAGSTAYLVPKGDPAALADGLARYLEQPERLGEHARGARRRAEAEFGIDGMVSRYAEVYDAVLGRTHPA